MLLQHRLHVPADLYGQPEHVRFARETEIEMNRGVGCAEGKVSAGDDWNRRM